MQYHAREVKHKIRIYANTNYFRTPTYNFMRRGYSPQPSEITRGLPFYEVYAAACGGEVDCE